MTSSAVTFIGTFFNSSPEQQVTGGLGLTSDALSRATWDGSGEGGDSSPPCSWMVSSSFVRIETGGGIGKFMLL